MAEKIKQDNLPIVLHVERRAPRQEELSSEEIMKIIRKRASRVRKAFDVDQV